MSALISLYILEAEGNGETWIVIALFAFMQISQHFQIAIQRVGNILILHQYIECKCWIGCNYRQ